MKKINFKIVGIKSVSLYETPISLPDYPVYTLAMSAKAEAAPTTILASQQIISQSATISYII